MTSWIRSLCPVLLLSVSTACGLFEDLTDLEVINENNPDRWRTLEESSDVEALVSSGFFLWHDATYGASPSNALSAIADEGTQSWGGYGVHSLSSEPRVRWDNGASWRYSQVNKRPWYGHYEALSSVYDGLLALEARPELCEEIDCDRAHAFAKFVQGLSHGFLGLMFDSAFVLDETVDLEDDEVELRPYPNLISASLGYLEEAIYEASGANWSLPSAWIRGNAWSSAQFAQFAHSHAARIMYQQSRSPSEHAAQPWDGIIAHVDAGITPGMGGIGCSTYGREGVCLEGDVQQFWWQAMNYFGNATGSSSWHRADYKSIGVYDPVGYGAWLAASLHDRDDFVLNTTDERIHPPGAGDQDGLDFVFKGASPFPTSRGTYHYSMYMNSNYEDYANGDQSAPMPQMLYVTQQLIKAEGLARTGDLTAAAEIADRTRVGRANLPPASRTDINTLLEQIWYEYVIENYYVCAGCVYFARRGWAPLAPTGPNHHWGPVEGTLLHFPVPGLELEILQKLNYSYGGVGNEGGTLQPAPAFGVRTGSTVPATAVYAFNDMTTVAERLDYIWRDRSRQLAAPLSLVRH
jgi:hypothetical protein